MSQTLQLFLLEVAIVELTLILGIALVAVSWLAGWIVWLVWRLFYVAWAGYRRDSYDVDEWPDRRDRATLEGHADER